DQPRDDRLLPDREPDAVTELEREGRFLVGEPELGRGRPDFGDLGRGYAGPDAFDRQVEEFSATLVGLDQTARGAAHRKRAVVARAVAHEGVEDVEIRRISGPQDAVGEDVRVRVGTL